MQKKVGLGWCLLWGLGILWVSLWHSEVTLCIVSWAPVLCTSVRPIVASFLARLSIRTALLTLETMVKGVPVVGPSICLALDVDLLFLTGAAMVNVLRYLEFRCGIGTVKPVQLWVLAILWLERPLTCSLILIFISVSVLRSCRPDRIAL